MKEKENVRAYPSTDVDFTGHVMILTSWLQANVGLSYGSVWPNRLWIMIIMK